MTLTTRAKSMLLSPKTEWSVISGETDTPQSLLGKYVIPMALIPAVAMFIGFGLIGTSLMGVRITGGISIGLYMGLSSFIGSLLSYFISSYVVDALAPSFDSSKNIGKSAQLVAYSYTATWVAGILFIFPNLGTIAMILGIYGIYLFYLGLPVLKRTPEDKQVIYMIVSAIVIIVIGYVVNWILGQIIVTIIGNPLIGPGFGRHPAF